MVASAARNPWPRRIAYAILISYALFMFLPFVWSVVTSIKTLPDSVRLTLIPDPFTLNAYDEVFNKLDPSLPRLAQTKAGDRFGASKGRVCMSNSFAFGGSNASLILGDPR